MMWFLEIVNLRVATLLEIDFDDGAVLNVI